MERNLGEEQRLSVYVLQSLISECNTSGTRWNNKSVSDYIVFLQFYFHHSILVLLLTSNILQNKNETLRYATGAL